MKKEIEPRAFVLPTPVSVVGTYDTEGKPYAMTAAWGGICCSKLPCVGVSVQRVRHIFDSINLRKAFSLVPFALPLQLSALCYYTETRLSLRLVV